MTGKRRRKTKSMSEIVKKIVRPSNPDQDEQGTTVKLSSDLLGVILSLLNLKDNIRASAVCKRWLEVATSVRVANKPLLLMIPPKVGNIFNFYDPSLCKRFWLKMPELEGTMICSSKYGWLLLFHQSTHHIFFFCPYTRESIQLPNLEVTHHHIFSAPPKSPDCILLTFKNVSPTKIRFFTCRPGASTWTINSQNHFPFIWNELSRLCFCNGRVYCMSSVAGHLGVYDPVVGTWFIHSATPPVEHHLVKSWWEGKFMAEHEGNILAIYICVSANPVVYKLDETRRIWMKVENLGALTVFAKFFSSHCKMDLAGNMRNNIYFSKIRFCGKQCLMYSLSNDRYYPRKYYDRHEHASYDSIWIEPPEDPSVFL